MTVLPCEANEALRRHIEEYAEVLKTEAHKLGAHGLNESEFYNSGIFRGAIERIRGQFSATMRDKREFAKQIFNHMQDRGFIRDWDSAGDANRHDYALTLRSGRIAVVELKGCLDGNNTNIFERPQQAQEFYIWSVCTNPGADPRHNAWSGIHTRLSAEIVSREQRVDGLVMWDMVCGTVGRPCPKFLTQTTGGLSDAGAHFAPEFEAAGTIGHSSQELRARENSIGQFRLPPPCIYVFPGTIGSARNNPAPVAQSLDDVQFLASLIDCFGCREEEVNFVDFEVQHRNADIVRKTRIRRAGQVVRESEFTVIRRT
jgi:hypothetical protein